MCYSSILCAIIYSNTNSLKFFCENSSLSLANFTERVTFGWPDSVSFSSTHIENFSAQPCPFLSTLCRRFARWTETSTYSVTFDTSTLLTSLDTTLSGKGSSEVPSITIMGQLGSKAFWCFILHTWYLSILLWPLWFISALSLCNFDTRPHQYQGKAPGHQDWEEVSEIFQAKIHIFILSFRTSLE